MKFSEFMNYPWLNRELIIEALDRLKGRCERLGVEMGDKPIEQLNEECDRAARNRERLFRSLHRVERIFAKDLSRTLATERLVRLDSMYRLVVHQALLLGWLTKEQYEDFFK